MARIMGRACAEAGVGPVAPVASGVVILAQEGS